MRLLDRYLLRELLLPLGMCQGGFLVFWAAFDLLANLSDWQKDKMTGGDIFQYYIVTTPGVLIIILPVALLLALLYALTHHAKHNEITAMRAADIGLWRLAMPYLLVGFVFSVLTLGVSEWVVPKAEDRAEELRMRRLRTPGERVDRNIIHGLTFDNGRARRSWYVGAYDLDNNEMATVQVGWRRPDGTIARLFADRGVYTNGCWVFHDNVKILRQSSLTNSLLYTEVETNRLVMGDFTEPPEALRSEVRVSRSIGMRVKQADIPIADLLDYLRFHPRLTDRKYAWLHTKLHGRLAAPWTCLVVVLIAIPFGAQSGRRNVFFGVAGSIFIGFAYFVLMQVGLAMGSGGILPPWLAAWLPNFCFGLLSFFLIARVR